MKKTLYFLLAAIALFSAASCQKEVQPEDESQLTGGRVITASFATNESGVKTTLDNMTPKWADGDVIMLADGTNTKEFTLKTTVTDPDTQAQITNAGAKFSLTVPSAWGDPTTLYAVYPSSAYSSISAGGDIKIQINQLQTGTFAEANICVAKTTGSTLSFKNATSILKIDGIKAGVDNFEILCAGIYGIYTISNINTTPQASTSSSFTTLRVEPTAAEGPYYVAVGAVAYSDAIEFTLKNGSNPVGTFTAPSGTLEINKIYNLGYFQPDQLDGVFSVGASTTVKFSRGNLQASWHLSPDEYRWYFAANQYNVVGNAAGNTTIDSQTLGKKVDLFGWSTNATNNNWGIHTAEAITEGVTSGTFKDWGNAIGSPWRTLTKDEWEYLLVYRAGAANKVGFATVGGVDGLIILPDSFTDPMKNGGSGAFVPKSSTGWTQNVYTTGGNWEAMEAAGAVFLPRASFRLGNSLPKTFLGYWSATLKDSNNAYCIISNGEDLQSSYGTGLIWGISVRLVRTL